MVQEALMALTNGIQDTDGDGKATDKKALMVQTNRNPDGWRWSYR
jgi:hypothetical protein